MTVVREPDWERRWETAPADPPRTAERKRSGCRSQAARVLIIGAGAVGRSLARNLEADPRYQVVGFVDDAIDLPPDEPKPLLGSKETVPDLIERYRIDEVVVAYAPTWQNRLVESLATRHPDVALRVVPSAYEALMRTGSVESRDDIAVVKLASGAKGRSEAMKRAVDLGVSLLGLVALLPVWAALAGLIRVSSPGRVIFAQERIGRDGKPFTLYKFRTMVEDAESQTGPVLSEGDGDPRLTRIGRLLKVTRLDELPQLYNVVKGDMSLVGPRPERPYFVERYERTVPAYAKRHQVRPGITGLAQVCGGYHTDPRDKLRFDLLYASHRSLRLDLSILCHTLLVVFRRS